MKHKPHHPLFLIETLSFTFWAEKSGREKQPEFCGFPTPLSTQMGLWIVLYKNISHLRCSYSMLSALCRMKAMQHFVKPHTDPVKQVLLVRPVCKGENEALFK